MHRFFDRLSAKDQRKLAHMHASVGVPDEEVVELQARWGTSPARCASHRGTR
jgi:hypothetical protein